MITTNNQDLYRLCLLSLMVLKEMSNNKIIKGGIMIFEFGLQLQVNRFSSCLRFKPAKENIAGVKKRNSIAKVYINNFGKIKFQQTKNFIMLITYS